MRQNADDIWRSIVSGIELELQTQFNALNSWAEILDGILDQFQDDETSHESPSPIIADEILDDIREAIKHFSRLEDQLREDLRKTYGDQGSNEA